MNCEYLTFLDLSFDCELPFNTGYLAIASVNADFLYLFVCCYPVYILKSIKNGTIMYTKKVFFYVQNYMKRKIINFPKF